jgi:hypothetical protein
MDTLRGNFADRSDSVEEAEGYDLADDDTGREAPPPEIGQDERRMQVRAYNHWASLLQDRNFPSIDDLEPDKLTDFGPYSVLLDFTGGIEDPGVSYIGDKLALECDADAEEIRTLSDVPSRSLLSRITDHYMQILANQAPIGFEAEFVNQRGATILYRGILLPYSSDDDTIDFIYGVINWKELADQATTDELMLEIDQALEEEPEAAPQRVDDGPMADWADGPAAEIPEPASEPDVVANLNAGDTGTTDGESAIPSPSFGAPEPEPYEPEPEAGELEADEEEESAETAGEPLYASLANVAPDSTEDEREPVELELDEAYELVEKAEDGPVAQAEDELELEAAMEAPSDEFAPGEVVPEQAAPEVAAPEEAAEGSYAEPGDEAEPAPTEIEMPEIDESEMELGDWLASARELAMAARSSEDRTRNALYDAVGRAYDFSLAAAKEPEEFEELLADSGLTAQDRAPMTPVVKLVFGADYDKTRLTEYAAALSYAHRNAIERGALGDYLRSADGGLKGVVKAERRARREEAGKPVEPTDAPRERIAKKLRKLQPLGFHAIDPEGREFALVMIRRTAEGEVVMLGEIPEDVALVERAARKLLG